MSDQNENQPAPELTKPAPTVDPLRKMLQDMPGGFSVAPDGTVTADREAIEIKSIDQFSKLVREPKTVSFELHGGKVIKFQVRPLDAIEQRVIDDLDAEAPLPPIKGKGQSPSLAQGRPKSAQEAITEYDWTDKDYRKKIARHRQLKQAAIVAKGLLNLEIPGDTVEKKADFLAQHFTTRILDGIENAINGMTSEPIERAVFT